jgi:hypothetical protein
MMKDNYQYYTLVVEATAREINFDGTNNRLKNAFILDVVTRRSKEGRGVKNLKTIVNDTVFESTSITLRENTSNDFLEALPITYMEDVRFAGTNSFGVEINRSNVDLSASKITVNCDESFLNQGEFFEFTFRYIPFSI